MTHYRKARPYRKPQTYRGSEAVAGVTPPAFVLGGGLTWATSAANDATLAADWQVSDAFGTEVATPFGDLQGQHDQPLSTQMRQLDTHDRSAELPWSKLDAHDRPTVIPIREHAAFDREHAMPWSEFEGQHTRTTAAHFVAPAPHNRGRSLPWAKLAAQSRATSALWRGIVARGAFVALPWGPIGARHNDIQIVWPVEPPPQPGVITIPILPVYVMLPTLSCVRLPDRTPINILGISLQGELGSWAWTFTAPVTLADTALLNAPGGEPTQIEVNINGYLWTFIVDGYDDNRKFGLKSATLRGRSRSALLAEPYASPRTYTEAADLDASQLAAAELPGDWTLLWDAVDFLVPGGTFSYQDLAPIDAISQVANAIGAHVLSDPADLTLSVVPGYIDSPWVWSSATPYAILPANILTAGDSSWQGGVNANGVYVYAQNAGSGAFVKITGSDGSTQVPMIVERLAVSDDPQRERGRIALANAGIKRTVNRTIPLFPHPAPTGEPDFGPVPLGKLLEVEDVDETWRGQVVSVRIDAQRGAGALSVRQHLTIERQYR